MKDRIILDLCGGTGSWSKPYKDAGYDVRLVTLPEYDVRTYQPPDNVYGILAAPPCTMFSIARRNAKLPPDFDGALGIVMHCYKIFWFCRGKGSLKFWAMENPRGLLRHFIGWPAMTFQQWEYGGRLTKTTDIWGWFQNPRPTVKIRPDLDLDKEWQKPVCPSEFAHLGLSRTEVRAITPPGFAMAFFKANP